MSMIRTLTDIDRDLTRVAVELVKHHRCTDTVNGNVVHRCPEGRRLIERADALLDERHRLAD